MKKIIHNGYGISEGTNAETARSYELTRNGKHVFCPEYHPTTRMLKPTEPGYNPEARAAVENALQMYVTCGSSCVFFDIEGNHKDGYTHVCRKFDISRPLDDSQIHVLPTPEAPKAEPAE